MFRKTDMHLHSKYSEHPSEWFLQRLGAAESYTEPEYIYKTLKAWGMDFVTITDHNSIEGSLILTENHPGDTFTGVEATSYFPEDGCKIHILIYGLNEKQFNEIQIVRKDIYLLRDYIKNQNLPHSVAHATFPVNGKLKIEHLEKLILLFDTFEGINGGRNMQSNNIWMQFLKSLSPSIIENLYSKHKIEPFSDASWIKGLTGGSDDHAGIFLGQAVTITKAENVQDFLSYLKAKETVPAGKSADHRSFAFSIYKTACDFSRTQNNKNSDSFLPKISKFLFEQQTLEIKDKIFLNRLKAKKKRNGGNLNTLLYELINDIIEKKTNQTDKMKLIYSKIEDISDESLATFFKSLKDNITKGEILNINSALLAFLPGLFLPVPFFSAVKHLSFNKKLLSELQCKFDLSEPIKTKKILWFTDTLTELNGVSMSLRQIGRLASEKGANITFAASITEDEMKNEHGYEILNIPCIESFKIPFYESYTLRIPSILKALEMICSYSPDEIYISTPGPMGLLGMLAAKLLTVKTEAIYHTDFSREADKIFKGESEFTLSLLETYMKWFYDSADEISVPTKVYLNILKDRGYNLSKMKLFKKGLNLKTFFPQPYNKSRNYLKENFGVGNGINLLYAGRISKDKDINFLFEVYKKLQKTFPDLNLLLAGDGPDFEEFKQETDIFNRNTLQQTTEHPGSSKNGLHAGKNKVTLLGTIDQNELRHIYSGSDIFVFPSTTDTFGMAVLEAQACGLPAVVSDIGGPMEIVINGKSGFVLPALDLDAWYLKITEIIKSDTADYNSMRKNAEQNAADNYDLEKTFYSLFPKISIEVA